MKIRQKKENNLPSISQKTPSARNDLIMPISQKASFLSHSPMGTLEIRAQKVLPRLRPKSVEKNRSLSVGPPPIRPPIGRNAAVPRFRPSQNLSRDSAVENNEKLGVDTSGASRRNKSISRADSHIMGLIRNNVFSIKVRNSANSLKDAPPYDLMKMGNSKTINDLDNRSGISTRDSRSSSMKQKDRTPHVTTLRSKSVIAKIDENNPLQIEVRNLKEKINNLKPSIKYSSTPAKQRLSQLSNINNLIPENIVLDGQLSRPDFAAGTVLSNPKIEQQTPDSKSRIERASKDQSIGDLFGVASTQYSEKRSKTPLLKNSRASRSRRGLDGLISSSPIQGVRKSNKSENPKKSKDITGPNPFHTPAMVSKPAVYVVKSKKLEDREISLYNNKSVKFQAGDELTKLLYPISTRRSASSHSNVFGYSCGTHNGLVRTYNEDRLAIALNFKIDHDNDLDTCSFFGVYDGHGGVAVAETLKNKLHPAILHHADFKTNPRKAIEESCSSLEESICTSSLMKIPPDRSGACANFCFVFSNRIIVANIGDSRTIMSRKRGAEIVDLSEDHKPESKSEQIRIQQAGGSVYKTKARAGISQEQLDKIRLPWRVVPGRLSVSRTFGDVTAKVEKYGGKAGVITAEPDITETPLNSDVDFVILCCDGVFDRMESKEVIELVWNEVKQNKFKSVHVACEHMVTTIFTESLLRMSYDNLSIIFLAFEGFSQAIDLE